MGPDKTALPVIFHKKIKKQSLLGDMIQILLCLACLIICALSFSWFTMQTDVSASGISLAPYSLPYVTIAKVSGGVDIAQLPEASNKLIVSPVSGTSILPGSSGSFNIYLSSNFNADYNMRREIITYAPPPDGTAFRTLNIEKQQQGLTYVQTHIACFLSYDPVNNIYSDWIPNDVGTVISLETTERTVTVYWVWLETYTEYANIIAPADLAEINDYMDAYPEYYFDPRNDTSPLADASDAQRFIYYNYADENIGVSLNNICFQLTFVPD